MRVSLAFPAGLFFSLFSACSFADQIYFEFGNEDKGSFTSLSEALYGSDHSDGNFSQGLYLSYSHDLSTNSHLTYFIEQDIYTPFGDNKRAPSATIGDRPFAAFLGTGVKYRYRSDHFVHKAALYFGVIGPDAKGKEVQDFLHSSAISADEYAGWDDQVDNRYGGIGAYNLAWRIHSGSDSFGFELSPHVSLSVGNLLSYQGLGATIRLGSHLREDYGPRFFSPLSNGEYITDYSGFSWNIFAGFERRHIDKNYLLEGKTSISKIQTVDAKDYVTDTQVGVNITYGYLSASVEFVNRSEEFVGQSDDQQFIRAGIGFNF